MEYRIGSVVEWRRNDEHNGYKGVVEEILTDMICVRWLPIPDMAYPVHKTSIIYLHVLEY